MCLGGLAARLVALWSGQYVGTDKRVCELLTDVNML